MVQVPLFFLWHGLNVIFKAWTVESLAILCIWMMAAQITSPDNRRNLAEGLSKEVPTKKDCFFIDVPFAGTTINVF